MIALVFIKLLPCSVTCCIALFVVMYSFILLSVFHSSPCQHDSTPSIRNLPFERYFWPANCWSSPFHASEIPALSSTWPVDCQSSPRKPVRYRPLSCRLHSSLFETSRGYAPSYSLNCIFSRIIFKLHTYYLFAPVFFFFLNCYLVAVFTRVITIFLYTFLLICSNVVFLSWVFVIVNCYTYQIFRTLSSYHY